MAVGFVVIAASIYSMFQMQLATADVLRLKKMNLKSDHLRSLFHQADMGRDGHFGSREFIEFLHSIDLLLTHDELENIMQIVDEDHTE